MPTTRKDMKRVVAKREVVWRERGCSAGGMTTVVKVGSGGRRWRGDAGEFEVAIEYVDALEDLENCR